MDYIGRHRGTPAPEDAPPPPVFYADHYCTCPNPIGAYVGWPKPCPIHQSHYSISTSRLVPVSHRTTLGSLTLGSV